MSVEKSPTALSAEEIQKFVAETLPEGFIEPPKPAPVHKKICVALLAYDAKIHTRTAMCLMQALMDCHLRQWGFTYLLREGDSMVARGRSFLASQFLENPGAKDCTDLVFIDTDLSWSADEFIRLVSHPVDVVGAAYPYKDESGDFPLRWPAYGLNEENGLWNVQAVTPGFLRITRKALEKIVTDMPFLEFKDRANAAGQRSWMFFDNLQRPTGVYDEGYVFCEHWRQAGGKVWLDPDMNITHIGAKAYNHGTIRQWLNKKSQTFEQLEADFPGHPPLKLMQIAMTPADKREEEIARLKAEVQPTAPADAQPVASGVAA